ncbi:hypothetical protein CHGG_02145 [Chaetomium globosum CBS 148.51]|uniref:Aminoglycoside phosphotransferase domain-containing protein n=1 Tax=Chaetomium globosum (strain ATCC 6205 / CBS 148.51 / DSM 1962 / NBRC 6347 / NRRL 1970) TaxID=306901 RepID=Q2HCA9_CHAGB|nr:uncharacterized protein CHGG_02145 [Chaetomium globosum CBS 148.51]EAQ90210.1 hypothetical protein CHGG_02145 [Chaetomium globosum CBS 148.51]
MSTAPRFIVSTKEFPPAERAVFLESSFFSRNGPGAELPSPADVRARSDIQNSQKMKYRIPPVRYEELGLIVKFGRAPQVRVDEGQCLWALRHALPKVPVPTPKVYGWTHDHGQVFIYMELVHGVTLAQRWGSLNEIERNKPTNDQNLYRYLLASIEKATSIVRRPAISFSKARETTLRGGRSIQLLNFMVGYPS